MIAGTCDRDEGSEADRGETGTVASPGDPRAASDGEPAHDRGRQRDRSTSAVVALVAVVALFGFFNRWNDTVASDLEQAPRAFAESHVRIFQPGDAP